MSVTSLSGQSASPTDSTACYVLLNLWPRRHNSCPIHRDDVEQIVRSVVLERLKTYTKGAAPALVVHASARHIHLCREHLDQLFGPGHELTVDHPLHQPGNFAAKETVTLIGPRSRLISNLRILGPLRDRSQVELAFTDAISLGLENVPVRLSGDIDGTPGLFHHGAARHRRAEAGRHSCRDPRAHESLGSGILRSEASRPDEIARWRGSGRHVQPVARSCQPVLSPQCPHGHRRGQCVWTAHCKRSRIN